MSGLGLDLIDPKIVAENERAPAQPSEFVRGARAGTYGLGSSLRNAVGAGADAFGLDNFAAQQFGEADRLSLRAQQAGPRVGSLEQLGREGYSLRNMGDYAAGVVGGAAPSIGLGLGASLASGGTLLPSLAAGTAAFTPFEAGDAVAKWRAANPGQQIDGQTALRLGATGVGSAAFQSVVPAMVGGKLLGHGAASAPVKSLRQAVGRNLAEIPMEGFTEGAGELIKQTGATPDAPTDWGQVGENAVAGMIGSAPMAGLGAGGDYLHGNAQAIGGAVDKGVGAVRGAADRAAGAVTGAARGAADATAPVVRDAWDGVADMAKAAYDGTVEGFKASDLGKTLGERAATVRTWAKEIIDDPATPEGIREGLRSAVAGAGNKANQAYAWAAKQARDAQTAAQEKGVKSAAADALRKLREKTDDTVDRVLNDDFLGDAATMAKATGDRVTELSQESGRKAAEFATKWGNELLDRAGVSEETKAQVAEALRNVGDRASQVTIATAKKAADATEGARTRAKAFVDGISKGTKEGAKDGTKKSEDYSGARQAVNDVLARYRSEIPAAAFEDPETSAMLAEGLRQFVQIAAEPGRYDTIDKHWVRAQLGSLLGPRSTDILNDVFDAVGSSDPDAVARRYEVLNDLDEMNKSSADLTGVLQAALPEGSPLVARQAEDADVLTRWARGELTKGMPEAQAKFEDRRMQEYIQETYGDKAEVVLAALEGHAKQGRDMQHQRATADELEGEIDEFDGSTSEREDEGPDVRYIGLGAGKRLVTNPEVYRAQDKTGKPGSGDDLLEKLKERYPQADIRFVSVVEKPELIEMIPSVKGEMTKLKRKLAEQFPNDPDRQAQELEQARLAKIDELRVSGKGMFEVVNNPNEYRFTQPDIEAMRLDTERFGRKDHPSRLEVPDGPIFDAVRVAKTMMRKINRNRDWAIEDDRSDGHRLARAFSDGVAALMEEYGRFKVSPDTLIGTVNGKPFYARDIKGLEKDAGTNFSESDNRRPEHIRRKATADDAKSADELQAELDALALTIEAMELEDGDPQTLDRLYGREAKLTERLERVSMEENAQDTVEELGQQTADSENDNIVKAGAALREGDLQRKAQAGTANSRVPNAKPLIALAEKIRDSNAPAREKIADRLQTLALNIAMLSRKDQERLLDLKMAKKVSEVSGTINDLARKYADQIVAPKDAPPDYTPKPKAGERTEAQDRAKIINEVRRGKNTNVTEQRALLRELEAQEARGEPMGRFATEALAKLRGEGSPDPKAAAAKKAAFLKKAASGDAALIKELKASNDAKGLQRAVEALNAAELTDANEANIIAAVEAINARLSELVRDPDVAYGMGTKKYSLMGVGSRVGAQGDALDQNRFLPGWAHAMSERIGGAMQEVERRRRAGVGRERAHHLSTVKSIVSELSAKVLVAGDDYARTLIQRIYNSIDQVYAQPLDAAFEQELNDLLGKADSGVGLNEIMSRYAQADLPDSTKAIARAVKKVAGDVVVVRAGPSDDMGVDGFFEFGSGKIYINSEPTLGMTGLILHEGAHAATVAGLMKDKALQQAVYDLLDHVVKENPKLASAYGMTNSLEFFAEGLSNIELQNHLKQIKASDKVRKYLGESVASAWDAFVGLVRRAMGLGPEHESALSQLLDLSGRAMRGTAQKGGVRVSQDEVTAFGDQGVVDPSGSEPRVKELLAHLGVAETSARSETVAKNILGKLTRSNGKLSHADALAIRAAEISLRGEEHKLQEPYTDLELASNVVDYVRVAEGVVSRPWLLPAKLSTQIHNDLKRPGFAATHDSPIRHEGTFNWREHTGKGEGNAAFGAGTYLSTGDKVHAYYKKMMSNKTAALRDLVQSVIGSGPVTAGNKASALQEARSMVAKYKEELEEQSDYPQDYADLQAELEKWVQIERQLDRAKIGVPFDMETKSPTYHVSVQAMKAQLLNWDKPLSEQSSYVRKRLEGVDISPPIWEEYWGEHYALASDGSTVTLVPDDGGYAVMHRKDNLGTFPTLGAAKKSAEAHLARHGLEFRAGEVALTGEVIYNSIAEKLGSQAAASDYLQSLGILGHEYAASNGRDSKTPNYVIYDDSKIETNYVHFSAQKAAGAGMSQKGQRQILDAIRTMLGNSVKVMFKNLPHAGEFERVGVDDVIRISVHALNPTTVAYHESLHAFFAKLMREGNGDIADVLMRATKRPAVAARLRELLAGEPAALKQLRDPEERAAYMFQFWANGDAKLAAALKGEPQNLLQRIAATLRKVLGIWSNEERALHIMEAFSSGEYAQNLGTPNAFHRAMMEPGRNKAIEAVRSLAKPLAELGDVMVAAGSARLRESRIPSLVELADVVKAPLTEETGDPGFVPAARLERTRVLNALGAELAGLSRDDVDAVRDILQTGNNQGTTPEQRLAARAVRKLLQDQLAYLRKAGVGVKDLGPDYFPRVYDAAYISKHQDEFRAVLDKYGVPADTMHKIIANGGTELGVEVDRPGMQAKKKRVLDMIPDAELAPFMQKDLYQILNSYVTQATRRAEWARRMGDDSARLHTLLAQAKKEGATPAQIEAAEKYVKGVNGTLGDDINPTARRLMGDMIVYQNIRLLPLAIFSSVVDPMGVLVRGGEMKDAWNTFKRGIREIPKGLRGDTSLDESARIADALGVIDNAALVHDLGALYSQGMVGDTARKVNDTFFRFNLMEQFNRSMRVGATEAALKFMERHSGGNASTHSARWMRELGLMRGDVQVVNGRVALTQADGLTAAQEARIRTAVNRWVDGAVLRPDAADKPIWMNDPHWALVAHLKQFVYAFHHTILKRVGHEMRNGNYAPAMALASYVPIMIAADVAKGMLQNGGDEPEWKKNWGLEDYVASGVQRAGLLGVGQLGADAYTDVQRGGTGVGALVGPTFEQMGDALQVMGGHKQFGSFALRAMPANALYSGYLDEARADLSTD